jgi:class 3 adenylate cyclase
MTAAVDNAVADLQRSNAELQHQLDERIRQLDERTAERDEALEQQTATAEVLQVINASPGDLAPVFDAIVEKALKLCDAEEGALRIFDGEVFHLGAVRGDPASVPQLRELGPIPAIPGGFFERIVHGERVVHIADVRETDTYRNIPTARQRLDVRRIRSWLAVALHKENILFGAIIVQRREVRPFSDKQIALLQNFAAQAVIAMENARLITETREALEQQTATAEVLGVINSSPGDLAPVFDVILEKAHSRCGAALGSLVLLDGQDFRAVATRGYAKEYEAVAREGFPARAFPPFDPLSRGEILHNSDVREFATLDPITHAAVEIGGIRTVLLVPLRKEGTLLGYISAQRQKVRPFSDGQIALLENFAAQAVIAMENARLITETREALEQQTATAEVLGVINASPGDLAPVFDAILDKALGLCEASFGLLNIFDGEFFRANAWRGVPPALAEFFRQPFRVGRGFATRRLAEGQAIVHIEDITDHVAYRSGETGRRALADIGGARTVVWVALRAEEELRGFISMYRTEVRPFTDKQIALLQNFAAQAVIAIENARLLGELRARTDEIAGWNRELEARVATQLAEIERTGKLRRFLAPQLAELIVAQGDESILESHRREIVVVFCDLRGFTGFAERAEPEEVMALLRDYHAAMGPIVARFEGTLDHYAGDGIMVFFNDPVPTPDPARRAIEMAVAMRAAAQDLLRSWRRHGHDIGFGVGISQGYATLGQIGFAERMDYTAIGTVTNLAARLCAEAKDGQILISRRVAIAVEDSAALEEIGDLSLKGLSQAVAVYNVPQVPA